MTVRSLSALYIKYFRQLLKIPLWLLILGSLVLFYLQYQHSPKLEELWVIIQVRRFGDPILAELMTYFPPESTQPKYVALGLAVVLWIVKVATDTMLQHAERWLNPPKRPTPPPPAPIPVYSAPAPSLAPPAVSAGPRPGGAGLKTLPPDSELARQGLLKNYREIEKALKGAPRKLCSFLSIEIVHPSQLRIGEDAATVAATFQAFQTMLNTAFEQYGVWKHAWTPEGVLVCFLQRDLAFGSGQRILLSLENFNSSINRLRNPFRVRCGLHEGEVPIYEDTPLERMVDQVIDVAVHLQKQARPNTIWVSADVYNKLPDRNGFHPTDNTYQGQKLYQWSAQPVTVDSGETFVGTLSPVGGVSGNPAEVGQRIGRYEIEDELGRGAMGAVYKARDPQLGRTVAIKVILTANLSPDDLRQYKQRFYREAQAAGQMSHPGIVTIHDVAESETSGQPYLVMEFVEGKTLDDLMDPEQPSPDKNPFTLEQILEIGVQVADALDYAHRRGVIHRDIKPANILVTKDGKAKIADFGVAKLAGAELTQTGQLVGTPAYMSPEQLTGDPVDGRSDIFSFGAVLYSMVTSQKPFSGDTITAVIFKVIQTAPPPASTLNPSLPPEVDVILSRCLAKKPDERYPNGRALATDLEALKNGRTLSELSGPTN